MAEKSHRGTSQRDAVEKIRKGQTFAVELPVVGKVRIPRPDQIAYFGGLAALAAFEIIDWPIALAVAAGHVLASNHHDKVLQELGEVMESA